MLTEVMCLGVTTRFIVCCLSNSAHTHTHTMTMSVGRVLL